MKLVRNQIKNKVEKLGRENEPDYKTKYNKLSSSLLLAQKNLRNRSIERRVLRAVLYDGCVKKDRMQLISQHDVKFGTGQPEILARADYNSLIAGNNLEKKNIRTLQKVRIQLKQLLILSYQTNFQYQLRMVHMKCTLEIMRRLHFQIL